MAHTLVVIRHAKSDWDVDAADRDRPLAKRGRRQAPPTGRWLAAQDLALDLAVVSPAARARQTWELVAAQLAAREVVVATGHSARDVWPLLVDAGGIHL